MLYPVAGAVYFTPCPPYRAQLESKAQLRCTRSERSEVAVGWVGVDNTVSESPFLFVSE